jgi:hypothetical protein
MDDAVAEWRADAAPLPYRRMARIKFYLRRKLDIVTHDIHALRYRGVMELACAGCDDDEIASFSERSSKETIRKHAGIYRQ